LIGIALLLGSVAAAQETPAAKEEPTALASLESTLRPGPPPIDVTPQILALDGAGASIEISASAGLPEAPTRVEIRDEAGDVRAEGVLRSGTTVVLDLDEVHGGSPYFVFLPETHLAGVRFSVRTIPGWLTVVPPVLAIVLALLFRQVILALLAGVWSGAWIYYGDPLVGALRTMDHFVIEALGDSDRVRILIFSLLLGGMVGIISRSGGTLGLVDLLAPHATTSRRGQLVTWLMGIAIFFDDYANTLLVGNTMRPVTDRLKISREKLAYIVDSTAAPVASIALVSTWIGYEVSLVGQSLDKIGSDLDPYGVFIQLLPYNFYPALALVFGLMVASSCRDFGPMLKAERRAARGRLLAESAVPLADFDDESLKAPDGKPRRWFNAAVPILVVLVVTFWALWITGKQSLSEAGSPLSATPLAELGLRGLGGILGEGNSYNALLYASMSGCLTALLLAIAQRILTLTQGLAAWLSGIKSMGLAVVILILAWSIGDVCAALDTQGFMVEALSGTLDPRFLPALVFVLAAVTAFATGTSWATMGILIPLAVPTAFTLAQNAGIDAASSHRILLASVSSVLAGAIFGDHCSPISDTTVLSSTASACDHVDHVRTQLPYALAVAGVALACGYLPAGFGLSPFLSLAAGTVVLGAILFAAGRSQQSNSIEA
jgi:Na+/H+ antiporter NhaC